MSKERYFVYCKDILGVSTDIRNFKWIYGSVAPESTQEDFEKCLVKFYVRVVPEKDLPKIHDFIESFQAYYWNEDSQTLSCRRKLLRAVNMGYDVRIDGNSVFATVGANYYRLIKNRVMNLHGMYYLLADLANIMLLKNGYATLYASAVFYEPGNRCVVNLAPPNTGKTLTATSLCALPGFQLVGEDVVITDGNKIFSCPWTSSYRKKGTEADSAGAFGRVKNGPIFEVRQTCEVTDVAVLSIGDPIIHENKDDILNRVCLLNGYLFQYNSSPVIKILACFSKGFRIRWNELAEQLLGNIVSKASCVYVRRKTPDEFSDIICSRLLGEEK